MQFPSVIQLSSLAGSDGFAIEGISALDRTGGSVSHAGDVNGDGIDDVIVGAHLADANGSNSGASYVVFGRTIGFENPVELSSLGSAGFVIEGGSQGDSSGVSVSAAGDVNGDGIDDLIVGASIADPDGAYSGTSYVVFGRTGGFAGPVELSALGSAGFAVVGASADDASGSSVSAAGDVNGDGIDDVIIGARDADPNGSLSGASYVVFGRTGGFAGPVELSSLGSAGFAIAGGSAFDRSGWAVSGAGDVNGDGVDDMIVGAPYADLGGTSAGASYVVFGRSGGFAGPVELSSLGSAGFVIVGASEDDASGFAVSGAGDVNGDGVYDVIVGARAASPNGNYSGASYVVFGRTGGYAVPVDLSSLGSAGFVVVGGSAQDSSGLSVSGAGDVNGDGIGDLIVGAPGADTYGGRAGASYVILGRPPIARVEAISVDTGTVGDGVTTDRTLTVSGTATVGTTVHVFRGAVEIGAAPVAGDGTWSFVDLAMLAFGPHVYLAQPEGEGGKLGPKSEGFDVFVVDPAKLPSNGNDAVMGNAGANQIQGGEGNDTVFGEDGNDTLKGNNGNDWQYGGEGSDRLDGENGNDVLRGGNGTDTVYGQNGSDTLRGDNGNDRLEGGAGLDSLDGGTGNDTVYGGIDRDTLLGGTGGDRLFGDADGDWLLLGGDTARDTVFGTVAHLTDDTIDGFVDGVPTVPGADMVFVQSMTNAQRAQIDGDILDAQGRLFLPGGGVVTFLGHAGAEVDAVLVSGGVQVWLV